MYDCAGVQLNEVNWDCDKTASSSVCERCPIQELIVNDALKSEEILQNWEIVGLFPVKYEAYSVELLKAVVTLWTTVRCFAFTKGWNKQFQRKLKKHGTRSTLKRKGKEKKTEYRGSWIFQLHVWVHVIIIYLASMYL